MAVHKGLPVSRRQRQEAWAGATDACPDKRFANKTCRRAEENVHAAVHTAVHARGKAYAERRADQKVARPERPKKARSGEKRRWKE